MSYSRSLLFFAFAAQLIAGNAAWAQDDGRHWSQILRQQIDRAAQVDWRLGTLQPGLCPGVTSGTGIAVDSISVYDEKDRDAVRHALAMSDAPQVASVASGSPAGTAGIMPGDDIVSINGAPIDSLISPGGDAPMPAQVEAVLDALPVELPSVIGIERKGAGLDVWLTPVERCNIRTVVVVDEDVEAYGDEHAIALTTGLLLFTENDDELALVAGHELAHAILRKQHERERIRGKRKEDAADRLGAELAACAGYNLALANRFWLRFDSTRALSFLPSFTHRSSKARYRAIAGLTDRIDCATAFPAGEVQVRAASSNTSS